MTLKICKLFFLPIRLLEYQNQFLQNLNGGGNSEKVFSNSSFGRNS